MATGKNHPPFVWTKTFPIGREVISIAMFVYRDWSRSCEGAISDMDETLRCLAAPGSSFKFTSPFGRPKTSATFFSHKRGSRAPFFFLVFMCFFDIFFFFRGWICAVFFSTFSFLNLSEEDDLLAISSHYFVMEPKRPDMYLRDLVSRPVEVGPLVEMPSWVG